MHPTEPLIEEVGEPLKKWHGCHTAILYGSYAKGDFNSDSDIDIAGFAECDDGYRIAGPWRDTYLDIFVYPEGKLAALSELSHLKGGRVLYQRDGAASALLKALDAHDHGSVAISANEEGVRRKWAWKMLRRTRRGDAEGNFRRVWLLFALLEDSLVLRGIGYGGPKEALAWLAKNAPDLRAAFDAALDPGASLEQLETLVSLIAGPAPSVEDTERLLMPDRSSLRRC